MLRQTLSLWLERKSVRPVMSRAGRTAGRPLPTLTTAAAVPSSSPGYHSGNIDGLEDSESLDLMDGIPIEPLGRPVNHTALAHNSGRNANAQALLSRLERKYHLPPAGVQSGAGEHKSDGGHEQRSAAGSARRVMSASRRPHSPPPAAVAMEEAHEHTEPVHSSIERAAVTSHAGHPAGASEEHSTGGVDAAHESSHGDNEVVGSAEASSSSTDAYRFLLSHIDAEIAALQRRHSSVTTRRQNVLTRQTQRIKELFEVIEAPWTLLPTEMQPALPATGVDVYIKEQQLARQQRLGASSNGNNAAGHDGQDKMYVLALHKNYKSMPAGRKRFYEEAASYNAAVRAEMKFQLTRGCARFEAFLDRVKECTMEMAREGQMPELPSGHAHQRFQAQRGTQSYRNDGAHRAQSTAGTTEEVSRGRKPRPQADREGERGRAASAGEKEEDAEGDDAAEQSSELSAVSKAAQKKGRRASQRIKEAAKTAAGVGPASSKKGKGGSGRKAPAHAQTSPAAKASKGKKKATKAARPVKAASGGSRGVRSKKAASAAASPGSAGVSRSIPLPNFSQLAMRKTKKNAVPPSKKKKAATAASKTSKAKAAGGRKK